MASPDGSKFPKFADADVLIVLNSERTFQLHANVLRSCSAKFAELLPEDGSAKLTRKAISTGATLRWRLDLEWMGMGKGAFVPREVDRHGRTRYPMNIGEILNAKVTSGIYKNYENILKAFYNEPLEIDGASFMTSLQDCWGLTDLAETYGAVKTVSDRVDVALIRHGKSLYRSIANDPVAWMNFACQIKSEIIFRESMIHAVGLWQQLTPAQKRNLTEEGRKACDRKHVEFQTFKQAIEMRIAGHYPDHMHKSGDDNPGRSQYANDIYAWVTLSLFRHWFCQNTTDGTTFRAQDGGFRFYSLLAKGGKAYLDRQQCEAFHVYFPMTHKAKLVLENYLTVIKSEVQQFVAPLMRNNTSFDLGEGENFTYLVSATVEDKDFPWKALAEEETRARLAESRLNILGGSP